MAPTLKTFADNQAVAAGFAAEFADLVQQQLGDQEKITVALSGGSTPRMLFELLAREYADVIDWNRIHFFWSDERCVPPDHDDSNYGVANDLLLSRVGIDPGNVHRMQGEDDPDEECSRYENEVYEHVEIDDNAVPQFDLIILGMGTDGHTASIFPHQMQLLKSEQVCEVAIHPETAQKRITLSGNVLNNAQRVAFLITGEEKAPVLQQVLNQSGDFDSYPTAHIAAAETVFYVDQAAASA